MNVSVSIGVEKIDDTHLLEARGNSQCHYSRDRGNPQYRHACPAYRFRQFRWKRMAHYKRDDLRNYNARTLCFFDTRP